MNGYGLKHGNITVKLLRSRYPYSWIGQNPFNTIYKDLFLHSLHFILTFLLIFINISEWKLFERIICLLNMKLQSTDGFMGGHDYFYLPGTMTSWSLAVTHNPFFKTTACRLYAAFEAAVGRFLQTKRVFMLSIKYAIKDYGKSTFYKNRK